MILGSGSRKESQERNHKQAKDFRCEGTHGRVGVPFGLLGGKTYQVGARSWEVEVQVDTIDFSRGGMPRLFQEALNVDWGASSPLPPGSAYEKSFGVLADMPTEPTPLPPQSDQGV